MRPLIPQRARRLFRRMADTVPLTWRGFFVAAFASLALWRFGYGTLDLLLFVIGICGLVLVTLAVVAVIWAAIYLRRRIERPVLGTRRLEAGSPIRTGFKVPGLSGIPLVKIGWRWLEPGGTECRTVPRNRALLEEVVARKRGQVSGVRRRFRVGDAFGLAAIAWERDDPGPLTILPDVGRLKNMPVVQPMAAAEGLPHPMGAPEGDRMEIRRYVPGDSVRNILWKTFARTRQLNVRIPEKSIDRARKTVAYLLTGPEDEAAAAAARVALENEMLGMSWLFGADGTAEPADSLDAALQAIARSGSYRGNGNGNGRPAGGLASFLGRESVYGQTHCIVFAPAHSGDWTTEALAAARNFSGAVSFVLGTDGVVQRGASPLWRRVLFVDPPTRGVTTDELSELLRVFSGAGCPAVVVDRASGRAFGHHREQGLGAMA
ncbi:MAG: DUF58 domain-containing protein [bacterium]|nr:DUF58 domain-containing protein [bacterium]